MRPQQTVVPPFSDAHFRTTAPDTILSPSFKVGMHVDGDYDYNLVFHRHDVTNGTYPWTLRFNPDFPGNGAGTLDGLAYKIFDWDMTGYEGASTLAFDWKINAQPLFQDNETVWVGFYVPYNHIWDWYELQQDNVITLDGIYPYLDSNGIVLVNIAVTGTEHNPVLVSMAFGEQEMRGTGPRFNADMLSNYSFQSPLSIETSSSTLPATVDLANQMSECRDQLQVGACVTFGITAALDLEMQGIYESLGWDTADTKFMASPRFLYVHESHTSEYDCPDDGIFGFEVYEHLLNHGTATEQLVPFLPEVPPGKTFEEVFCNHEWPTEVVNSLRFFDIEDYWGILAWQGPNDDARIINELKYILSNHNRAVAAHFFLDSAFLAYLGNEEVWNFGIAPQLPILHAMAIVGYSDAKQAFKVRNSWGTDWGNAGYVWIGYDTFRSTKVFDPRVMKAEYKPEAALYFCGELLSYPPATRVEASLLEYVQAIRLDWQPADGATEQIIHRDEIGDIVAELGGNVNNWTDSSITDRKLHTYWIQTKHGTLLPESAMSTPEMGAAEVE
jgi:C1A family cysteine protease